MRRGALLQVTTWGPATAANGLHEYAFKLWSGLVAGYYRHRWSMFVDALRATIQTPAALNMTAFDQQMFAFEAAFVDSQQPFASVPSGDAVAVSSKLRAKYADISWNATTTSLLLQQQRRRLAGGYRKRG